MHLADQFINQERMWCDSYRLFSVCFYYPQKELFLEARLFENLSHLINQICPAAYFLVERMGVSFSRCLEDELAVEYARLFVGPFQLHAPPYGSVYLEGGQIMGASTVEVVKMYQEFGLALDEDFKELPDHIAVELEFMSFLIFKEVKALEEGNLKKAKVFVEKQEVFLSEFLLPWAPTFCERIRKSSKNEFYQALADCLDTFLRKSSERLSLIKESLFLPEGLE